MHIQYYLTNGEEISYQTSNDVPTMEDVNQVALLVAQKRPDVLPEYVYISVRIYGHWVNSLGLYQPVPTVPGTNILSIWTSVGPLAVKVMPWAWDVKLFMVGRDDDFERYDFERYDVDKIFEEVVLKDCDRE